MSMATDNKKILNVPNLRFPEFDGEWEGKTLESISPAIFDGTHQTPQYTETGIPFFSVENIVSGNKNKFISEEDHLLATKKNKPEQGDVLITRIGNIGSSMVVNWDYDFSIYVTLAVIKKSHQFDSYYLHSFIQSGWYQKEIRGKSLLNAVPCKINMEALRKTTVLLASMPEQAKIANFLRLIDDRIATQIQIIKELETLMKGLICSLVRKKGTNALLKDCLICHSSTLMESAVAGKSGSYPVYGAAGIIANTPDYEIDGDAILVIKDGASVGKVQYTTGRYSVIGTLNYLKPKGKVSLKYFYYYLQAFNFDRYRVGSGIPHIYFKGYGNEPVYCPSIEEQSKIAYSLSAIDEKLETERQILKAYTDQKKYLLSNLFI